MPPRPIPYFSAKELSEKVSMKKAIELMANTYAQISSGAATVPVRTHIHMPAEEAQSLFMPAYLAQDRNFGVKIVGLNDRNPEKGLPFIHAVVLVMDAAEGKPLALVDGTYLTALRTGAGSGIATQLLARENAQVLAIFGAGAQARTQIEAVLEVREISKVLIFNRTPSKAEALIAEMQDRFPATFQIGHSDQLKEADIICTATSSSNPVFSHKDLSSSVHINAIGAYRADMAEIPASTVIESSVFVDQITSTWVEAGDLIQPLEAGSINKAHIKGEIGQIVLEQIPGRTSHDEITLFKSVGNAAQDIAVAGALVAESGNG